jgi:chemotaxis protein MotB
MSTTEQPREPEIVIIRRRASTDADAPKGGVWKIAFADFMTAMMAFFLVLWLINSSNKEVKASVARYFNPIQLADIAPRRGLQDPKEGGTGGTVASNDKPTPGAKPASPENSGPIPNTKRGPVRSEGALFKDPYAALTEIAGGPGLDEPARPPNPDAHADGEAGLAGGEAFRDPFSPAPRKGPLLAGIEADGGASASPAAKARDLSRRTQADPGQGGEQSAADAQKPPQAEVEAQPSGPLGDTTTKTPSAQTQGAQSQSAPAQSAAARAAMRDARVAAAEVAEAAKIRNEVAKAVGEVAGAGAGPKVDVQATAEGLLISLTDEARFAMFASGSAEPDAKVVRIMERVAQLLKAQPGPVVIRGHTDARPYRSATYDNWRLSSARAHMAQYMLVRGGLPEQRIEHIEGYAERRPKLPGNPEAAENRRVEILLRKDKT